MMVEHNGFGRVMISMERTKGMGNTPNKSVNQEAEPSRDMDRQISGLLQAMYGSVESEPIPERFLDLLEKLDAAEKAHKNHQSI